MAENKEIISELKTALLSLHEQNEALRDALHELMPLASEDTRQRLLHLLNEEEE